jgi:hypothetical protein
LRQLYPTQAKTGLEWATPTVVTEEGWPIQARFWLEWVRRTVVSFSPLV